MMARRSVLIGVFLFATSVLGPASAVATSADGGSTRTARVKAAGVALEYPSTWTVFVLTKKAVATQRRELVKSNPRLGKAYLEDAQMEAVDNTKFSAGDFEAKLAGRPAGAVSVVLTSGFPATLEEFAGSMRSGFGKLGASVVETSHVRVGGQDGYRMELRWPLTAPDGTAVVLRMGSLVVPRDGNGVLVIVVVPDGAENASIIADTLASVRLI